MAGSAQLKDVVKPTIAQIREFMRTYRQYRAGGHSISYAANIAAGIAFRGLPF